MLGSIPLYFEQNRGQAPNGVDYITRAAGRSILISATHAELVVPGGTVRMSLAGARSVRPDSLVPLRAQVNYLLGTSDQWITHISTWQRVRYPGVYPGIDLIYHGTGTQLEYDFVVAPDADPSVIRLRIDGSQPVRLDAAGDAVLQAADTAIHLRAPTLYQEMDGARQPIEGGYRVDAGNALSFAIGAYDHTRALVIDPVIVWAGTIGSSSAVTYSQGSIAVDSDGNTYVGGSGGPPDVASSVPQRALVTPGAGQNSPPFVAKLDPGGTMLWISYLYVSSHLALDSSRAVWVADGLVYKLSPAGDAIVASIGLFDKVIAIAVDGSDNVYLGGTTTVFKLTPSASQVYATTLLDFLHGQITALTLDPSDNVYIAGWVNTAFAGVSSIGPAPNSQGAAFAARMKPDGSGLTWAAYVAGVGTAIATSPDNNIWLTGYTTSTSLPVTPGAFASANAGGYDGFIAKMDNAGTAISVLSYLGGQRDEFPGFLAVASDNSVFIAGTTQSADFPTVNPIINPPAAESLSLFATTDGGVTWHRADASLPGLALGISADPSPGTLVAATDSGLYRSINNGATWQQQFAGFFTAINPSNREFLTRDVSNSSIVWAGANPIERSADGGVTWSFVGTPGVDLSLVPGDPNTFYTVGSDGRIYQVTHASGLSWSANALLIGFGGSLFLTTVKVGIDGVIYASGPTLQVIKNDAQGAPDHWTFIGPGSGGTGQPSTTSLGVSATNANVLYAARGGTLYRTADTGAHWSTGTQSPAGAIARITVAPSNDLAVWAVTDPDQPCGTATLTKNGGQTWTASFPDLAGVCVIAVAVSPTDPNTAWAVASPKIFGFLGRMTADGTAFQYSTLLPDVPLGFTTNGSDAFLTGSTTPGQFALANGATSSGSPQYGALFVERIASACSYSVSPAALYDWTPATVLSITVTAASSCAWTVSGLPSWLSVTSGGTGSGNGVVMLAAASNPSDVTRSATMTIGSVNIPVVQADSSGVVVLPNSGGGSVQTFAGAYYAPKGYQDLQWVQMLYAVATDGGGESFCLVHYDVQGNAFWLYGDGGFFVGPITPGTPSNLLQNSLCVVNTSTSTVSGNGTTLTVNASVVFKAAGARNIYLRSHNLENVDSGWIKEGTWTPATGTLGTMTVSPASGNSANGLVQIFTLTYPDPAGFAGAAFGWEQFLVGTATGGGGNPLCYVHYDRGGNGLWVYSGDVGYFLGPVTPGTASSLLTSSACSINTAGATVANTSGNLLLTVPIVFKAPMVRGNKLFQRTLDVLNRDTGFEQTGTWTVN